MCGGAQETNNRTFCQSSKCFSIAVSQESGVPSAIFNDFSELLGEGWKVRSVASVQLCRRMLGTPSRRPFLHSATHDFSFRLILYQLEEEKALPPKVAYYGILYRIFPLSRAAAANPARGPSFPLFWHSEKMSAYYLFTRRTRRRARATVPRLKMERAS